MRLKLIKNMFVGAALTLVAYTNVANAGLIVEENFESDGLGVRYTAEGAGGAGLGCCQNWSLNSQDEGNASDVLIGFGGQDFWSGSDLDDGNLPSGFSQSTPRNLILNMVDLSAFTNLSLSISLAASGGLDIGGDFLRVFAINADTNGRVLLDFFNGTNAGSLSGANLGVTFQNISYDLSGLGFSKLKIGFEAWTTSNSEVVGIDNIRLEGEGVQVPEPSTLAIFALGMMGLASRRFKKQS